MPRRSKRNKSKLHHSSRALQLFFKNKNRVFPDNSILISSAAVDAYRFYCGGSSIDLAKKLLPIIKKIILKHNANANKRESRHIETVDKIKISKIKNYINVSVFRFSNPDGLGYTNNIYVSLDEAYIRYDLFSLENEIMEDFLLNSSS